jgi:hypothetical protein
LIADLDSEEFSKREAASCELAKLGESAEPALRTALSRKPSLEMRKRFESLLHELEYKQKRLTPCGGDYSIGLTTTSPRFRV